MAEMPLTPKGYCDSAFKSAGSHSNNPAEMPLTPKGYCDAEGVSYYFSVHNLLAEMPLTPKGYCDIFFVLYAGFCSYFFGRNAPNAERLL